MQLRSISVAALLPLTFALSACTAEATSTAPDVEDDALDTLTAVTLPGGQTMTANTPVASTGTATWFNQRVSGSVTFSGPSASIGAGACLLNRVENVYEDSNRDYWSDPVPCNTAADCSSWQIYSGGYAYCTAPNGGSTKYCYVRPGTQADFCVGTPATHANITVPATLTVPPHDAYYYYYSYTGRYDSRIEGWTYETWGTTWLMYACYGPSCSPNSVSSARVWDSATSTVQN